MASASPHGCVHEPTPGLGTQGECPWRAVAEPRFALRLTQRLVEPRGVPLSPNPLPLEGEGLMTLAELRQTIPLDSFAHIVPRKSAFLSPYR